MCLFTEASSQRVQSRQLTLQSSWPSLPWSVHMASVLTRTRARSRSGARSSASASPAAPCAASRQLPY